jgi:UDP-N-acetylmuramyl pentapeptide phosphotransferase/UDP-N-acetylglucosamine-1-phosphate transferase
MTPLLAAVSVPFPESLGIAGRAPRYVAAFVIAFLVVLALTPGVRRLAVRLGMVDDPDPRRVHLRPTPRGGGVAVFLGFHLALVATGALFGSSAGSFTSHLRADFFVASLLLLAVGLLDDLFSLKPWLKLAGQLCAATILYANGIHVNSLFAVGLPAWLDYTVTMFWFLGAINAFNLIDGMDGLAAGLALIASAGMAGSLLFRGLTASALPFLALAGACLGFLRYNFHPASIFLGDAGSMFLGLTLATLALTTATKQEMIASLGVPLLAMGVPIFDTALAIWRRSVRAALPRIASSGADRVRVMQADREHVHHRVLARTMNQRRASLFLFLLNAVLVTVGIAAALMRNRAPGIYLVAFVVAAFLVVRHLARVELLDTGRLLARTRGTVAKRLLVPLYIVSDVCALTAVWMLARWLAFLPISRSACLTSLPLLVGSVFLALAVVQTYGRVWSRALTRDYIVLSLAVTGGSLLGAGLNLLFGHTEFGWGTFAVIFWLGAHFPVIGLRLLRGALYDISAAAESHALLEHPGVARVLAYGGGSRLRTFLLELRGRAAQRPAVVVGVLDDDINLRGRVVYGIPTMGTLEDLPAAAAESRATCVLITTSLSPERRRRAAELAAAAGLPVFEWRLEEAPLA